MDPVTAGLIASGIGAAVGGIGSYFGQKETNKQSQKNTKMSAKEEKRRTLADLLNRAMQRKYESNKDLRTTQADLADSRRKALSDMASGFRQSLLGG